MGGYIAPLYLLPGEIRGSGSPSISQCSTPSPVLALAGGGGGGTAFAKGTGRSEEASCLSGPPPACSSETQKGRANKGIFRWSLWAFHSVFPRRERQPRF